ncbi:hypothetical protein BT69DRAFT_1352737 [Atractiella rhizophila]|nr:hypothetical protein BT69DRAFT_1352737 [Atractiella rhizophila]
MSTDKAFGLALLGLSGVIFTYYTIWALFSPFLPEEAALLAYFPAREWAIRLPALAVCILFGAVGFGMGVVLVKRGRARRGRGRERIL